MRDMTGPTTYQMRQTPAPRVMKPRRVRNRREPTTVPNASRGPPSRRCTKTGLHRASRRVWRNLDGPGTRSLAPDSGGDGTGSHALLTPRVRPTGRRPNRRAPTGRESRRAGRQRLPRGAGPAERAPRLPARARRHPCLRGRCGAPLPRGSVVGDRRVPRRRHVLRAERLPHHVAARHRMGRTRAHRPAGVLGAPGPAAAARAVPRDGRHRRVRGRVRRAGRARSASAPTRSPRSATSPTGGSSSRGSRTSTSSRNRRRCGTCGRSRSRSSSTWSGRSSCASCCGGDARLRVLLVACLALIAASAILMAALYVPGRDPSRVYYGTDTRAQSLLIGAVVGILVFQHGPIRSLLARRAVRDRGRGRRGLHALVVLADVGTHRRALPGRVPARSARGVGRDRVGRAARPRRPRVVRCRWRRCGGWAASRTASTSGTGRCT